MLQLLFVEFILYLDDERYDISFIVIVAFIWFVGYLFKEDDKIQAEY